MEGMDLVFSITIDWENDDNDVCTVFPYIYCVFHPCMSLGSNDLGSGYHDHDYDLPLPHGGPWLQAGSAIEGSAIFFPRMFPRCQHLSR